MRNPRFVLIALGGNAFQSKGDKGAVEDYWRNAYRAAKAIVRIIKEGYRVVLTHGNGPQVGNILEWMEALRDKIPPMSMDIANAMTQGWLGYLLMQAIGNELVKEKVSGVKGVIAVVNQVVVNVNDPAFQNPTKYVGPYYTEEEARKFMREKGWIMKPDPRGGWRRVVPSPDPIDNVEKWAIKTLVDNGWIVIASGGGGIPVVKEPNGILRGVEAVIDKDRAGFKLAQTVSADKFLILTDVEKAFINYNKPNQQGLDRITVKEAEKYEAEGHFLMGSMGPKMQAAIRFVKWSGKEAIITSLNKALDALKGKTGTHIIP